jgi:hypothetical protein
MKTCSIINLASRGLTGGVVCAFLILAVSYSAKAYPRYNGTGTDCSTCHGFFLDNKSTKTPPTIFPSGDKHRMHRNSSYMNTDCDLCHTSSDGDNPYIGSSNGKGAVSGLGCSGCHVGSGLRAHHEVNGISCYVSGCHSAEPTPAESVNPPYYGTAYTKANNPCNGVLQTNLNENWSVGDFVGLDNDGDDLYDQADFDCGPPYRLISAVPEGANLRVTWETVGGRVDAVQASANVAGGYTDVSTFITNAGVGLKTNNFVEVGGGVNDARFYRIRSKP